MKIRYKDIPGQPGYRAGEDGSVWSCLTPGPKPRLSGVWRWLSPKASGRDGYLQISLHGVRYGLHRVILTAFVGPPAEGEEACHEDGDPSNNALSNLRWGTKLSNAADRKLHGTNAEGETCGLSKLSAAEVVEIRRAYASRRISQVALARRFSVSPDAIYSIVHNKTWRCLLTQEAS